MQNLIQKFNNKNTRLVISDWPEKTKKGEKNYGIAWYTKELYQSLAHDYNMRFVVLGEKGQSNKPQLAAGGRILVLRVFDQRHPTLFPRILHWLSIFNKVKYVDIHSEFCTNGGIKNFMLLFPFMLLIKLASKHITYYSHNVITSFDSIAPHLGYKKNSLLVKILNIGVIAFYKTLGILLDRFVVMDEAIYKRLSFFVSPNKIFLHPFWIEKKNTVSQKTARTKINVAKNDFILLYFGFITYYKGADWIIKTVKKLRQQNQFTRINLILAGGEAYSLKDKAYYKKFYAQVLASAKDQKKICITGFVPENAIGIYFSASDLVVLPYRGLIGSSATLSQAITHKKPFVISRAMGEVLKNKDVEFAISKNNINESEISFSHNIKSFANTILKAQDKEILEKLTSVSCDLGIARSKDKLLESCYNQLYAMDQKSTKVIAPALA